MSEPRRGHRAALWFALAIGVGLAVAPAIFGMFGRAPAGGQMIDDFKPYMTAEVLDGFGEHLDVIGAAASESAGLATGGSAIAKFRQDWPGINTRMQDMLTTIKSNTGRFEGLVALPPFWAFPWFFVLPGLMVAGVAAWAIRSGPARQRVPFLALAALGVAVIAAPAVFQMFSRAPGGAQMINDFRPLMTSANIAEVQGSFLVIAGAEGGLRNEVLAAQTDPGALPATRQFVEEWPTIASDMAPMIGAMADNLDNFAAVNALPPFWLFPWFFVLPGLLVVAAALLARSRAEAAAPAVATVPSVKPNSLVERTAS